MRLQKRYCFMFTFTIIFFVCFSSFCFAQIEREKDDGYTVPSEMNIYTEDPATKDVSDSPEQTIRRQTAIGNFPSKDKPWSIELYVKRYFISHTSYEFGNPYPPFQEPLSRLEFPMNTWWFGGEFRRNFSRFSAGAEVSATVPMESDLSFKDSDWTDTQYFWIKDIYSEAQCRLQPSYMARVDVDLKISDWLKLPGWFDLRPVAGIRWQYLEFYAHNGVQMYPAPWSNDPPEPLPGDTIHFKQTYWHYFLGIKAVYNMEKHIRFPRLKVICQLDWAYVDGNNSDEHLIRGDGGARMTYDRTRGGALHASVGLKIGLTENVSAGFEMDYIRIRSTGSHQWQHDVYGIDQSWDNGVKVWSDQAALMMNVEYRF